MAIPFVIDMQNAWLDYAIVNRELESLIAVDFFDRSATRVRSMNARLVSTTCNIGDEIFCALMTGYRGHIELIPFGRDIIYNCLSIGKEISEKYLFTTSEKECDDFYNYLMRKYRFPLLHEWIPYIMEKAMKLDGLSERPALSCLDNAVICDNPERTVILGNKNVFLRDLKVYEINLDETILGSIISSGLKKRHIKICETQQNPLAFESLDEYFETYSSSLLSNIDSEISPYLPIEGEINDMAFISKRLFPQQAACLNGMVELLQHQDYGIYNEGMGCGKTIQGIGAVELYFIRKYMKQHPKKTIEEIYKDSKAIKYRVIIMAPSHLVDKWKSEIESEVIFADVHILSKFEDVLELKKQGKKPQGKEWYIFSKEFAKLGDQQGPIPSMIKLKKPALKVCASCEKEHVMMIASASDKKCKRCGDSTWKKKICRL